MMTHQTAILVAPPRSARFFAAAFQPQGNAKGALERLSSLEIPKNAVIGIGEPLLQAARLTLQGLRPFPNIIGPSVSYPSTQGALWASFWGDDPGATLLEARKFFAALGREFSIEEDVLSFKYAEGRDLSGFEDGTENPKGEQAALVALVSSKESGMNNSSFVAVQKWAHDLHRLDAMDPSERSAVIGRDSETNEELSEAPASAHVKRSAQESYDPPAFMLRRSLPWGTLKEHGLYFVAFGASLNPFEKVLRRMAGLEDGIPDQLARFTRPISGGYYWCPPMRAGRLDLRAILENN